MAMTNEEIDAEIARLQSLKEQNNKAQTAESNKPATGIYNPADYVSQITNSMNKSQSGSGNKFSNNLNLAKTQVKEVVKQKTCLEILYQILLMSTLLKCLILNVQKAL